jgi:hypothetical protein
MTNLLDAENISWSSYADPLSTVNVNSKASGGVTCLTFEVNSSHIALKYAAAGVNNDVCKKVNAILDVNSSQNQSFNMLGSGISF